MKTGRNPHSTTVSKLTTRTMVSRQESSLFSKHKYSVLKGKDFHLTVSNLVVNLDFETR